MTFLTDLINLSLFNPLAHDLPSKKHANENIQQLT